MVKVCKTAAEFSKLKYEDFDYGPEIYGNIDVTGKILAETLSLDERTIRKYAERGIVHRSPENVGLYRFESSMHRFLHHIEHGALFRCMGIVQDNDYGRNV